ncbi:MAG: CHAT domain-containing protein, partial [Blastocatellia bacterium]
YQQGKQALAEQHFNGALKIRRKLEPDYPGIAITLDHLAQLYLSQNDYARAEPLFKEAVGIIERRRGVENPLTANFLFNFAVFYHKKGDYAQAEQLYRQVLKTRVQLLGVEHPEVATTLYNLALLNRAKGDMAQAVELLARCNEMRERHLSHTLAAGSERQKLAYLNTFEHEANDAISLHAVYAPKNPQALNLAFTTLLRRKGRGLEAFADTLAQFRRRATEPERALLDQLANTKAQFAAITLRALRNPNPENADGYATRIRQHSAEIDRLEAELSVRNPEIKTESVTLEAVQAAIPPGAALVELTRYRPRARLSDDSGPPRYAAYILAHQGQPRWVDLGEAERIERAVEAWRTELRGQNLKKTQQHAREVDTMVMQPVRALLGQTRQILLSPDGVLNLVPFAALVDEQRRCLVTRYSFTYLTSGRDLLRLQSGLASQSVPLILADPAFGSATESQPNSSSPTLSPNSRQNGNPIGAFQRLIFAEEQARRVNKLLPEATVLTGERATETALKHASGPRILHIITHGFFLPDLKFTPTDSGNLIFLNRDAAQRLNDWLTRGENPLLRSGLALAGANLRKSGDDDGLLTAMEAASLDLRGTKLVVLTACETGLGNVESGEGVYGLRRALVLAGAESQLVSLWKIPDDRITNTLISDYYRALQQGQGRSEALRQAQLKMLKQHPHPYFWAAFIPVGEWANLDGQRVTGTRQSQIKH